eukprot:scaffold1549_cov350-Prasinococcus_capsulatus_cf.AAC.1
MCTETNSFSPHPRPVTVPPRGVIAQAGARATRHKYLGHRGTATGPSSERPKRANLGLSPAQEGAKEAPSNREAGGPLSVVETTILGVQGHRSRAPRWTPRGGRGYTGRCNPPTARRSAGEQSLTVHRPSWRRATQPPIGLQTGPSSALLGPFGGRSGLSGAGARGSRVRG